MKPHSNLYWFKWGRDWSLREALDIFYECQRCKKDFVIEMLEHIRKLRESSKEHSS